MVSAGPMPGSTPTNVPSRTPSSAYSRLAGSSTVSKPSMSCESASTVQVIGVRPGGRSTPRNSVKATKSSSASATPTRASRTGERLPSRRATGGEERRGEHVAQRVQQQRIRDQGDEHADRRAPLGHLPLARGPLGQVDVGAHDRPGEEQQREDEQGGADQQRHEARPGGGVALGGGRRGGDQRRHRDAEQDQPPGARARPVARRRLVHSPSPSSAMMRSTRRFSAARKRVNSSPGL